MLSNMSTLHCNNCVITWSVKFVRRIDMFIYEIMNDVTKNI